MGAITNRHTPETGFRDASSIPVSRTHLPFSAAAIRATKVSAPTGPTVLNERASEAATRYATQVISASLLAGLWRTVEFLCLASLSLALIAFYDMPGPSLFARYAVVSVCGALAGVSMIQAFGGYDAATFRRRFGQIVPVATGWAVALAALALGIFFLRIQNDLSRAWLALWYACGLGILTVLRICLGFKVRAWRQAGRMERRAVIVGGGPAAEELIAEIDREPNNDLKICGIFDDRNDRRSPASVAGCPKLGNVRELVEFVRRTHIDMLIVTIPVTAEKRVLELLKTLWVLPVDIRLSSHSSQMRFPSRSLSYVGRVPLLEVFDRPITEWNSIAKRVFDIVIAGAALVALSPVLAATAMAIKLDSRGPVLFRQKRHGFNNQIIEVLKFRSMYHEMADPTAAKVVTRGDARVTPVGRFIRKNSLDELPQLWNVVRGDLSLVGPRPHAVHARSSSNEAFIEIVDDYFSRHRVKPGITGWAQINGYRGEIDHPDKLKSRFDYDLEYIDKWSIFFDVKILALTPIHLFRAENAY
ncbi:undecaprenyl-phosphate glucose phosphotransferase [Aureimonas psammosilenae]|uniref:undecaprenyl-phosphate glucose phosphotransferase n=1 Tax=Aureimonas psammosilenae TaxID=2495496 RepID=UPI0012606293|nr:undecaprenyl-phosphate glucose phosphotransferase [Aureimonas psammosilenae]